MSKKRFNFLNSIPAVNAEEKSLKQYYFDWRTTKSNLNTPFVALYKDFKDEHLASLEAGPLRLYLYFSFNANNQFGHSWHSIETISEFFGTQTRTIDNWIKVLIEKKLIHREKNGRLSHTTYLIPYSNSVTVQKPRGNHSEDNQEFLRDLLSVISERSYIYGDIERVFHLFQWVPNGKELSIDNSLQTVLVITKREDGVLVGHFCRMNRSNDKSINQLMIDELATFDSHLTYNNNIVQGIALKDDIHLNKRANTDALVELCEQLYQAQEYDFLELPTVDYGLKDKMVEQMEEDDERGQNND